MRFDPGKILLRDNNKRAMAGSRVVVRGIGEERTKNWSARRVIRKNKKSN